MRRAIVFHLSPLHEEQAATAASSPGSVDLDALRAAAVAAQSDLPSRSTGTAQATYIERSNAVREYALARAKGICECCGAAAPFVTSAGIPFLEVHHLRRLTDGGPDRVDAVASVCPNCHRQVHYASDAGKINAVLAATILEKERQWEITLEPKIPAK